MILPERCPFDLEFSYDEQFEHLEQFEELKKKYDVHYELRSKCRLIMKDRILKQFFAFSIKYSVFKETMQDGKLARDVILLNIVEDALRQNISDLSELIKEFIKLIDLFRGKYSVLLKKRGHKNFFEAISQGSNKKEDIKNFSDQIEQIRSKLFCQFTEQGGIHDISWYFLKSHLEVINEEVKEYRNCIGCHDSSNFKTSLGISKVERIRSKLEDIVLDFFTVFFWEKRPHFPKGPNISINDTVSVLRKNIWA